MNLRWVESNVAIHQLLHFIPVMNTHLPNHLHYWFSHIWEWIHGVFHCTHTVGKTPTHITRQTSWKAYSAAPVLVLIPLDLLHLLHQVSPHFSSFLCNIHGFKGWGVGCWVFLNKRVWQLIGWGLDKRAGHVLWVSVSGAQVKRWKWKWDIISHIGGLEETPYM